MDAPVKVGDVLAGKFRVERILGVGGMGVVVAAMHLQLDQLVALKFMLSQVASNPDFVSRFLREAKAAARLKNQHCAKVLDVGTLDDGAPYLVLEFLDGCDLQELIEQRGKLGMAEAVDYVLQACVGMSEAHHKGIVHRDLKPQNLFLARGADGTAVVKILDFGIAKASFDLDVAKTQSSAVMGSPYYMAPEQMRSAKEADARSDIWALGAILYHMLSGQLPFRGDSLPVLCVEIMTNPPSEFDATALAVPVELKDVVLRCLHKDPARRPQNITELARALVPFAPETGAARLAEAASLAGVGPVRLASGERAAQELSQRLAPTQIASSAVMPTTMGASVGERMETAPSRSARNGGLVVAGVASLAALSATLFLLSKDHKTAVENPVAAQATSPIALDASGGSQAPVAPVTFSLRTEPAGAQVRIAGQDLGAAPVAFKAIAGQELALRVQLDGHALYESTLFVDAATTVYRIKLAPVEAVPAEPLSTKKTKLSKSAKSVAKPASVKPVELESNKIEPTRAQPTKPKDRLERRLTNLKQLFDEGLLTDQEYRQRRRAIVDEEM